MKGAYLEVLSDALTSVGVIVAALVILFTGWQYADPLLSAAIGLFILPRTWRLMREVMAVLLEGTPAGVNIGSIREAILALPGVVGAHDFHAWSLTSGINAMTVHVVVADVARNSEVLLAVRECLVTKFQLAHVTIQVEPVGYEETETHL
jgi:cobalt-zinc-cadmium efflux system protein